jgi:hypothetical protein
MNHNKRSARYYDYNRRGQAIIWWLQRTKSHLGLLLDMEWDIRICEFLSLGVRDNTCTNMDFLWYAT